MLEMPPKSTPARRRGFADLTARQQAWLVWGALILLICIFVGVRWAVPLRIALFPQQGAAALAPPFPGAKISNTHTDGAGLFFDFEYTATDYTVDASFDEVLRFYKARGGKVTKAGYLGNVRLAYLTIKPYYATVNIAAVVSKGKPDYTQPQETLFTIKTLKDK
jgi:hypothetical protein